MLSLNKQKAWSKWTFCPCHLATIFHPVWRRGRRYSELLLLALRQEHCSQSFPMLWRRHGSRVWEICWWATTLSILCFARVCWLRPLACQELPNCQWSFWPQHLGANVPIQSTLVSKSLHRNFLRPLRRIALITEARKRASCKMYPFYNPPVQECPMQLGSRPRS